MIENLVGRTLAERYHVLELIGTGGMASVYKAQCELLKRDVAIKILRDSVKDDESALKSFKQEALAAAKLNHNNIVQIFDVGEVDGSDYMVMELVDGVTLKKYIRDNGPLTWNESCEFAVQIAQALEAAHSKQVVHRDIKPQNILMTEDKTLKVTDFGIAKAATTETLVAGDHGAMGSVHYISPEQARGGFTDARSDIYSLGIVLFEMLTGKVPFDGESAVAVALMHIEKPAPSVLDFNPSVPADVAKIVAKAISKEQSGRYQNATEMIADLQAVIANNPVEFVVPDETDEDDLGITKKFRIDDIDASQSSKKAKKVKKVKTPQQKKADRTATILAILTVVLIVLATFGIYSYVMRNAGKIQVPDFTNVLLEDASKMAAEKGITISDELEYSLSDTVEEGKIISQTPAAKTYIDKSVEVHLVVSIGSSGGDIPVPDVQGMEGEEAVEKLMDEELTYWINEEYSDIVPKGQVIRQSPAAGTMLKKDYVVLLYVSSGKAPESETPAPDEEFIVPDFLGETTLKVFQICQKEDLKISGVEHTNSSLPAGTVVSQIPEAGQSVKVGTGITVFVSNGSSAEEEFQAPTISPTKTPALDEGEDVEENGVKTQEFTVEIPIDKDTVDVKITVDGDTKYEKENNGGDIVSIDITGTGQAKVVVFFDGKIVKEHTVDMDS